MTSNELTAAGLIADIIGVVILFFWSPFPPGVAGGGAVIVESSEKDKRKERTHRVRGRFGLLLLILGFGLQLIGTLRVIPQEAATGLLAAAVLLAILIIWLGD